jgi:hypothetical protein
MRRSSFVTSPARLALAATLLFLPALALAEGSLVPGVGGDAPMAFHDALGLAITALLGWGIRTWVKHLFVQKALLLIAHGARVGASSAWGTYTATKKALSPDGKLSDEQKKAARDAAWDSALKAIGTEGERILKKALKDGWEDALAEAIEGEYHQQKPKLEAAAAEAA